MHRTLAVYSRPGHSPTEWAIARALQNIRTTNHVGRLCCTRALQTELQEAQLDSASRAHCSAA